jgi:transcriptional regulator with XRE-family HTH domain
MGRQKWNDDRFGKRVRKEREARELSQAAMAKLLADRGVHPMHPTTLAKIETGERSVRLNEAVEIAELFEMSLDSLLGRATANPGDELVSTLRTALDTAAMLTSTLAAVRATFYDPFTDLAALEFPGREQLEEHVRAAGAALVMASNELAMIAAFPLPHADNYQVTMRQAQFVGRDGLTSEAHDAQAKDIEKGDQS